MHLYIYSIFLLLAARLTWKWRYFYSSTSTASKISKSRVPLPACREPKLFRKTYFSNTLNVYSSSKSFTFKISTEGRTYFQVGFCARLPDRHNCHSSRVPYAMNGCLMTRHISCYRHLQPDPEIAELSCKLIIKMSSTFT